MDKLSLIKKVMSQADNIFKKSFRKHFANHEANFPPTRPIKVGDFGEMRNGFFVQLGNIDTDFGIKYKVIPDENPTHEQFKSEGSVTVNFLAKGDISPAGNPILKAQVHLSFTSEKSFFFSSAEVRYLQIESLMQLGERIMNLYNKRIWKKNYILVSSVLQGVNTILVISGSSGANVVIESQTEQTPSVNFADVKAELDIKTSSQVSYQIIAPSECEIGIGLSRIYDRFFNAPTFKVGKTITEHFALLDFKDGNQADQLVFGNVLFPESLDVIATNS